MARKLLIIDDEPDIGAFVRDVALEAGYDAIVTTSPAEFKDIYRAGVDVVVMDLVMPEADGVELIRYLAHTHYPSALILMSGFDATVLHSAHELAAEHGLHVAGSLAKPIHFRELEQLLLAIPGSVTSPETDVGRSPEVEELREALRTRQLLLHYQPQLDLHGQSLVGFEALVRWQHPHRGILEPRLFLPMVEDGGLMESLTDIVINQALAQAREWARQGLITPIAVNVPASTLKHLDFPERLAQLTDQYGLRPSSIMLEVTETVLMRELVTSLDVLTRLRIKGARLSIDDFGTGYSSMLQLHRVPFTQLKIDRSFICKVCHDEEARAIVETTTLLGHKLGMEVVAEGVENQAIMDHVKTLGCDVAQGFLIAKPMPAEEGLQWAQNRQLGRRDWHRIN